MTVGPNIAIGLTVVFLLAVAGCLIWKGTSLITLFGRTMFEAKLVQAEEDRARRREAAAAAAAAQQEGSQV